MKLVIIESPYAGDKIQNVGYAKECLLDSLMRGEAPFASHLLYTQVLDDDVLSERTLGISAGLEFKKVIKTSVFYTDFGMSTGMLLALSIAEKNGNEILFREILK